MAAHEWWHLVVLGSTLFGAAGLALIGLIPVAFDEPPEGFERAKPLVMGVVVVAGFLLLAEWLGVH